MDQQITIKILKGLPRAMAAEPQAFKLLETFSFMKALWVACPMPDTTEAKTILATASGRTIKTINRRLAALQQKEWIVSHHGRGHDCISWDIIADKYEITHKHYYHVKPCAHVHLEYILQAKAIDEKHKQCAVAFRNRVVNSYYLKDELKQVAGSYQSDAVAIHQLHCFKNGGRGYTEEEHQLLNMHYGRKETKLLRGDTNVNYYTLSIMFGLTGTGSIAYKMRRLQQLGLILVQRRHEVIEKGIYTTTAARKTRLGFIKWMDQLNQLHLILPDKITILSVKNLDERFKRIQAALNVATGSTPIIDELDLKKTAFSA